MIAHSGAEEVLRKCAEEDPSGVWEAMQSHLPLKAELFAIGFPSDIITKLPREDIMAWISQQPDQHALAVAHLCKVDLSHDATLSSTILGKFGDNERVAEAFFNKYISGPFWGPISVRWYQFAESLMQLANRTGLPKLARWARRYADRLTTMAEDFRRQEEEEQLHGR